MDCVDHAFSTLVRRHQSAVRGLLRRLTCGNEAQADDLAQSLVDLAPAERVAITLAFGREHTHGEVAVILDCPLGMVKTHIARGAVAWPPPCTIRAATSASIRMSRCACYRYSY